MKHIEEARAWLSDQTEKYKGVEPKEAIYSNALRLANKNQGVGFLLAALWRHREQLEYTDFKSKVDKEAAYRTYDIITKRLLS